ncbi:outer membrane protein assembly factor BamC [Celerinatantimonas yamalensis]|uniref:Outer membrane protein assembly factor BamC n=1 Tax=Celerinatantimonas yamalensis TaxID=559956 RepID=A0ABW9GCN4_9GAMM
MIGAQTPLFSSSRVRLFVAGSISVLLLSACSNGHPGRANGGFDYLNAKTGAVLTVPTDLSKPQLSDSYQIPSLPANYHYQQEVGQKVDIRPPAQVIALVPGELKKANGQVQFVFDRFNATSTAQTLSWLQSALSGYIRHYGGQMQQVGTDPIFDSGQLTERQHIDQGFFSSKDITYHRVFRYYLSATNEGREAIIRPQLLRYSNSLNEQSAMTAAQKQRQSIGEINRFLAYLDIQENQARQQAMLRQLARVQPITLHLTHSDGVAIMIADAPLQTSVTTLEKAFSTLGFKVTGYIAESGKMTLDYSQPSSSKLAPFAVKPVQLAEGKYKLTIGSVAGDTQVTISDDSGLLTPERVDKLFPALHTLLATGVTPNA